MTNEYDMVIDGRFVKGSGTNRLEVRNPSNGELVGTAPVATEADIDAACRSAQAAFLGWRKTPGAMRGQMMMNVSQAIRTRADEIARLLTREQGKTLANAKGEVLGILCSDPVLC